MLLSAEVSTAGPLEMPGGRRGRSGQRLDAPLEGAELALELLVLGREVAARRAREVRIAPPPVHPDLLCLVDRADDEADTDGEQLDLGQRDADVARDQKALVEDTVQHVDQAGGAAVRVERKVRSQC